jgi:tetratricopeptide (TPR) repeat protein
LGIGTKEVMVTAPLVALLYDRTFLAGSFATALRVRGGPYAGLAATWCVLLLRFDSGALEGSAAWAGFGLPGLSALEYARSQPGVLLHYLRLAAWPHPLVFDYGWPVAQTVAAIVFPTAVLVTLGLATLWALSRKPALGFLGACFFLVLAPTSSVMPIVDLAFEHRMYLPLAALVVAVVVLIDALLARASAPTWVGVALLVVIAVPLSAATALRNRDYRSALALWQTVVDDAPGNPRGHMNLGLALTKLGRNEDALAPLRNAIALDPDHAAAHVNLASALLSIGRRGEALHHFREATRLDPIAPRALAGAAWILATDPDRGVRDPAEAVRLAERAATLSNREDFTVLSTLATAYAAAGQRERALQATQLALERAEQIGSEAAAQGIRAQLESYRSGSTGSPAP